MKYYLGRSGESKGILLDSFFGFHSVITQLNHDASMTTTTLPVLSQQADASYPGPTLFFSHLQQRIFLFAGEGGGDCRTMMSTGFVSKRKFP